MPTFQSDQSSHTAHHAEPAPPPRRTALVALSGLLALAAALPLVSGSAVAPATAARAAPRTEPADDAFWGIYLELLELVHRILLQMESTPPLTATPEAWIDMIAAAYQANGAPVGLTPQQAADARLSIETLSMWTDHLSPRLDPNRVVVLQETLRSLYADLGGNPVDLDVGP